MEGSQNHVEKITPKVVLHFLRHSKKEKAPEKNDTDIQLTKEGRNLAARKYENPVDMRFAHVVGSPRIRTHETSATAATQDPKTNPKDLGVGKVRVNKALYFAISEGEYGNRLNAAFEEGKGMSFLVNESDGLARDTGDTTSSTYSRMAANIAGIIHRNYEVATRGASIFEQSGNPKNQQNDFERILATHGAIQECFLLKVAEKVKGVVERNALLVAIGENGFDFTEGFDATFSKENGQEQIRITYKKGKYAFDEVVPVSVIEKIIEEGK